MNIELKRIAEKKIGQMGGTPCGVLVRNEAGALAAVSKHGRVTWLDDSVMGPGEQAARDQGEESSTGAVPEATDEMVCLGAEYLSDRGLTINGDPLNATEQQQDIAEGLFNTMLTAAPTAPAIKSGGASEPSAYLDRSGLRAISAYFKKHAPDHATIDYYVPCYTHPDNGEQGGEWMPKGTIDLVRFLANTWSKVDKFVYQHCPAESLTQYPVVQGTRNQLNLRDLGSQPYDTEKLGPAVKALLSTCTTNRAGGARP